jgi:hypothetical protein
MPGLCYHFHIQPSEVRRLKVRELGAFSRFLEEVRKANAT